MDRQWNCQMNNRTTRNHYLPQFYLRSFSDSDGKVVRTFCWEDRSLEERRFAPKATGFERDLYTVWPTTLSANTEKLDIIEQEILSPIDNSGASTFRKLRDRPPSQLPDRDKRRLAIFLNSLIERHPRKLYENERLAIQSVKGTLNNWISNYGNDLTGGRKITDLFDVNIESRNLTRKFMVDQIRDEDVINYLSKMKLVRVNINSGQDLHLVTGDNPVVVNMGSDWPIHFFSISLSPNSLLLGFKEADLPDTNTMVKMTILHNIALTQQCQFLFSDRPLKDNELIKLRKAAQINLYPVMRDQ